MTECCDKASGGILIRKNLIVKEKHFDPCRLEQPCDVGKSAMSDAVSVNVQGCHDCVADKGICKNTNATISKSTTGKVQKCVINPCLDTARANRRVAFW
jgi:hypothetical protein